MNNEKDASLPDKVEEHVLSLEVSMTTMYQHSEGVADPFAGGLL